MTIKECLKRGLVRRASIHKEEVQQQLQIAADYIQKAERVCESEVFDISFLTSYISIFHSARALLYRKGYKERSHFCLFEVIQEEFAGNKEIKRLAEIAQNYRETRHLIQYEGSRCSESGAREAIRDAKSFLKAARATIG